MKNNLKNLSMRVEIQVDIKYSSNYYDEEKDICNEVKTVYSSSFIEKTCLF